MPAHCDRTIWIDSRSRLLQFVMPGLAPGIHILRSVRQTWMPALTGHDVEKGPVPDECNAQAGEVTSALHDAEPQHPFTRSNRD